MKIIATLDAEDAAGVVERLANAGIAFENRTITEESGIVATVVLVNESCYDSACAVVDVWLEDRARKTRMVCPKCQSVRIERLPHDSGEVLFKCKDCGCDILPTQDAA